MPSHPQEASPLCSPLRLLMLSCSQHIITVAEAPAGEVHGVVPTVGKVLLVRIVPIGAFLAADIMLRHITWDHTVKTLYGTPIPVSGFAPTTFIDGAENYLLGRFTNDSPLCYSQQIRKKKRLSRSLNLGKSRER